MKQSLCSLVFGLGLCAPVMAQQVWTVDDNGPADFATLPAALNAAADGDVLLLRDGFYSNLHLNGKSLTLVAEHLLPSGEHSIASVRITNIPAGKSVTLRGFRMTGNPFDFGATSAVHLEDNAGTIVFEDCILDASFSPEAPLVVFDCEAVFLTRCFGVGTAGSTPFFSPPLLPRSAVAAVDSNLYVHECTLFGGVATTGVFPGDFSPGGPGHDGAPAIHVTNGRLVVSGGTITGGKGGNNNSSGMNCTGAGDGGPAVRLSGVGSQLFIQGAALVGGAHGQQSGPCPAGSPGVGVDQQDGSVTDIGEPARSLELTALVEEGDDATMTVRGVPGEVVAILFSRGPATGLWIPAFQGALVVDVPLVVHDFVTLPLLGTLQYALPIPANLPPGLDAVSVFVQPLSGPGSSGNRALLGAPSTMTILRAGL